MMTNKLCIDLCCGRKGFSRAFADAGWDVITVDLNPKFNASITADVRDLLNDASFMSLKNPM